MKPKHTTLSITLILLLLALFSACNADASAGLFRQISESRAPIGIVYKQLLDYDTGTSTLYYRTDEGIYKTDLTTRTKMQASVKGAIIQAAYHIAGSDSVLYIINDSNDVKKTDNSSSNLPNKLSNSLLLNNSEFKVKNLYANGLAMLQGEDSSSQIRYELVDITSYPKFSTLLTFPYMAGYGLDSVLQMTGYEDKAASETNPMLISFVDIPPSGDKPSYIHYFYDGSATPISGLSSKKIAAFSVVGTELYALTSDGEVYGGTFGLAPMTFMYNSSKEYDTYAFFYSVSDGTTTHLISKTRNKNEALFVFSFPKGSTTTNVTTTSIKSGYAEYLDTADIVSALYIGSGASSDTLLVATNDNGLYKISINYASANSDSTVNGTSTKSEEYDFIPVP